MNNLSIKEIFSISWKDTKRSWKFGLAVLVLFILVGILDGIFGYNTDPITQEESGSLLFSFITQIVTIYLSAGFVLETINIADGKKPCLKKMLSWPVNFVHGLKYFGAYILYSVLILLPVVILIAYFISNISPLNSDIESLIESLIVSGIVSLLLVMIISVYVGPAYYLMIENRGGIFSNIKKSFSMVNNNLWKVVKWMLVSIATVAIPFIILGAAITVFLGSYTPSGMEELPTYVEWILAFLSIASFIVVVVMALWISISYSHLYRNIDKDVKKIEE